jgi:hypothetical protein
MQVSNRKSLGILGVTSMLKVLQKLYQQLFVFTRDIKVAFNLPNTGFLSTRVCSGVNILRQLLHVDSSQDGYISPVSHRGRMQESSSNISVSLFQTLRDYKTN